MDSLKQDLSSLDDRIMSLGSKVQKGSGEYYDDDDDMRFERGLPYFWL